MDSNKLKIFERKIIRKIHGAVNEEGIWRIRNNTEIEQILENENIVKFIKSDRIRWLAHVERIPKRIMLARMEGNRRQGRPRNRWIDEVKKDLQQMGIRKSNY